jgi:hypothetical protein
VEYRCISADCHIDLCWLPHDLFIANASDAMKDRMPYVVETADGPAWVTKDGANLGLANGIGHPTGVTGRRKIIPVKTGVSIASLKPVFRRWRTRCLSPDDPGAAHQGAGSRWYPGGSDLRLAQFREQAERPRGRNRVLPHLQ